MNILVTLNENYLPVLKVMLRSLFENFDEKITIYIMYSDISEQGIVQLSKFVGYFGHTLHPLYIGEETFADAPVHSYYSKEMYYRLIAHTILPDSVDKILYLDPDLLIINPIRSLYETPLEGCFFAAASHENIVSGYINKIRLNLDIDRYYNSGVLLMDVERMRKEMDIPSLYEYVEKNASKLILPDQDVLNGMYGDKIKPLDECLYNYDARQYQLYMLNTKGRVNLDYVINQTVILHFCGKQKPWHKGYFYRFGILYKHYKKLAERDELAMGEI